MKTPAETLTQKSIFNERNTIPLIANYDGPSPLVLLPENTGMPAVTQKAFLQHVNALAQKLPDAGYAFNLCEDRFHFLSVFCALLVKGTTNLLPLNRQPLTLKEIAQDYGNDCYCIFDSHVACDITHIDISQFSLNTEDDYINAAPNIPVNQTAAIAFTSGSTGKPKAIEKPWGTLASTAQLLSQRLLKAPTALVATVPPQHMYGLETSLLMVLQGQGIMHNSRPFFPADITATLSSIETPCMLISTPIHLRALIKSGAIDSSTKINSLQGIISATAPLTTELAIACENSLGCTLWEIYGCTEAGSMATRKTRQDAQWYLLEGFLLQAHTNQSETCTTAATAPHVQGNAVLNDTIQIIDKNHFLLGARHQDIINVGGKRASLADLNRQLLDVAGVEDGIVFMPDNNKTDNRPAAFVVSKLNEQEIRIALSKRIDMTLVPRPIVLLPKLPRNLTGKLEQKKITRLWAQHQQKHQ